MRFFEGSLILKTKGFVEVTSREVTLRNHARDAVAAQLREWVIKGHPQEFTGEPMSAFPGDVHEDVGAVVIFIQDAADNFEAFGSLLNKAKSLRAARTPLTTSSLTDPRANQIGHIGDDLPHRTLPVS